MRTAFVDTDVLVRLLTGDDPDKQARAAGLFERVEAGGQTVAAPDTVIADAVSVLSSPRLYAIARSDVSEMLATLVRLPHFEVAHRQVVLIALDLYAATNLDFGDALLIAAMQASGAEILYSFDQDFDGVCSAPRIADHSESQGVAAAAAA